MGKIKGVMGDIEISSKDMQAALAANADGGSSYIGLNDDMLYFGEAESFVDEGDAAKEFTINLVNNTDKKQKIQFNEIIAAVEGHTVLKEGVVLTDGEKNLTCEGDPRSYDILRNLIHYEPHRICQIQFNVSDPAQLDEVIKYQKETPFMTGETKQVKPSTKQGQDTQNTNMVTVDFNNWILSYDSTVLYTVRPGVSVSMTMQLGASVSLAHALRAKFQAAKATAARYYAMQQQG